MANPSHTFGATGTYPVTLTVTDNEGATHSSSQDVTVIEPDTIAPTFTDLPLTEVTKEASGVNTSVTLNTPSASDNSGEAPSVSANNMGPFPIGTTMVTWTATDASGNSATAYQNVTVEDTTPPTAPGSLSAAKKKVKGTQSTKLTWNASIDTGSGVDFYTVSRIDGLDITGLWTTTGTSLADTGYVKDGTVYEVTATDMMGNVSEVSAVTYLDGGSGGGGSGGGGTFCDTHEGHKRCPSN